MSSTADFRWCYLFDARALTHRFEQVDVRGLKPKVGVQGLGPLVVPEDVQCESRQAQLSNLILQSQEGTRCVTLALALWLDANIEYMGDAFI